MKPRYTKENVETHYGSDRPAVNVKVYDDLAGGYRKWETGEGDHDPRYTEDWIRENISDDDLDSLFWDVCGWEWEMIEADAEEILGSRLVQDGRSGGWAVAVNLPPIEDWDAVQLAKWRKFERFARDTADYLMAQLVSVIYINHFEAWKEEESERIGDAAAYAVATHV